MRNTRKGGSFRSNQGETDGTSPFTFILRMCSPCTQVSLFSRQRPQPTTTQQQKPRSIMILPTDFPKILATLSICFFCGAKTAFEGIPRRVPRHILNPALAWLFATKMHAAILTRAVSARPLPQDLPSIALAGQLQECFRDKVKTRQHLCVFTVVVMWLA